MKATNKCMQALAAIGQATTYEQIQQATGLDLSLLHSSLAVLKRHAYVERLNPEAPRCEPAVFRITSAGLNALHPEEQVFEPGETTVDRAIRKRPALATCWSAA